MDADADVDMDMDVDVDMDMDVDVDSVRRGLNNPSASQLREGSATRHPRGNSRGSYGTTE